jgi:hypothetical protein
MTYANHGDTESTENAQRSVGFDGVNSGAGAHPIAAHSILRASSEFSVSLWLAYVIPEGAQA